MHVLIAGGGIGGLTAALALHAAGRRVTVCEAVSRLAPLGVGLNILPHGAGALHGLGLGPAMGRLAIQTRAIEYRTRFGHVLTSDPRGTEAGFAHPQYSVHRGRLQVMLRDALIQRAGADAFRTGHRLAGYDDHGDRVAGRFETADGPVTLEADCLIGADGFHSMLRRLLHPDEGPAHAEGMVLYRGAREQAPFGDGRTMFIAGNHDLKFVCYPISEQARQRGRSLVNWVAEVRVDRPRRAAEADWTLEADAGFADAFDGFAMPDVDIVALMRGTERVTVYPMIDRDPLAAWGRGRVSLLGDAAHPMYPIGANGASQAILDADALARHLRGGDVSAGLRAYEAERLPATRDVVLANRQSGPEAVLDIADARLTGPDDRAAALLTPDEARAVAAGYRGVAGFARGDE